MTKLDLHLSLCRIVDLHRLMQERYGFGVIVGRDKTCHDLLLHLSRPGRSQIQEASGLQVGPLAVITSDKPIKIIIPIL